MPDEEKAEVTFTEGTHPASLPPHKAFVTAVCGLGGVTLLLGIGVAPANATPAYTTTYTKTFGYTAAQGSWAVPADVEDLTVTIAGAAGTTGQFLPDPPPGGSGGVESIHLGTAYAGLSLQYLVGGEGFGSQPMQGGYTDAAGGGATYLADSTSLLAVAGGGGGGGFYQGNASGQTSGGNGGVATTSGASGDGGTGVGFAFPASAGSGASGATPGIGGVRLSSFPANLYQGATGDTPVAYSGGTITPSLGGSGPLQGGGGGGGCAGGGGGSGTAGTFNGNTYFEYASGGGGSGYLSQGPTGTPSTGNAGDGYISFTYTVPSTLAVSTPTVTAGTATTATVAGLPVNTEFTLLLLSSPVQVATGTTDANGNATIQVTIPAGTTAGSHTLEADVGGVAAAASDPFTVLAAPPSPTAGGTDVTTASTLADTGSTVSLPLGAAALAIIGLGFVAVWISRRRRA